MSETRVEALYTRVKEMTVNFTLRPGERVNEVALARTLSASRTPLREALNRLVAERLLDFSAGKGFFCRGLDAQSIFDLYELRAILEESAVRLACRRASDDDLAALRAGPFEDGLVYEDRTIGEASAADEAFHMAVAKLSGNAELCRELDHINDRIRFIRWVDMAAAVLRTKGEHRLIMEALERRDADSAARTMRSHVVKRMDQIVASVREGYSNIYVAGPEELTERRLEPGDGSS
ncbi:GntR family transcriptional regulator [Martelella sp. HB161492]|uniref:GntR family transcriptional regulator n=1 Tax=Martelella sp. HB161492 TaxID=2720726 RepID=UPI001AEF2CEE|nr:GntR family transcriptional regulator [Martelella sp. HB161492]